MKPQTTIYQYQVERLPILASWGIANVVASIFLLFQRNPTRRYFGVQMLTWGVIDAIVAIRGQRGARIKSETEPSATQQRDDAQKLRRILLINVGLDIAYVISGWVMVRYGRKKNQMLVGTGLGFIPQGLFLLVFDSVLAAEISQKFLELNRTGD